MFHKKMISNSLSFMLGLLFLGVLLVDSKTSWLKPVRTRAYTVITPLIEFNMLLKKTQLACLGYFDQLDAMHIKIEGQEKEITVLKAQQNLLYSLHAENNALTRLLNVTEGLGVKVKVARIMQALPETGAREVAIDRGALHHIRVGQGVVNEMGVVGQISAVTPLSGKMILISDLSHALLAENGRNAETLILEGTGKDDDLVARDVPKTQDFQLGDLLVTSPYGKRFLPHYPVARVTHIEDEGLYSTVHAKPVASLTAMHFVIVNMEQADDKP